MGKRNLSTDSQRIQFPRVIAFFGPDGAGKSTQADLIVGYLNSKGLKVKKAWVRSTHTFAFLLWNLFVKLKLYRAESGLPIRMSSRFAVSYLNERTYGMVSPITMTPPLLSNSLSRNIWSIIEIISLLPVIMIQMYVPLLFGYTIVAERYVVDSIASIAYFIDNPSFAKSRLAKFLLTFIPKRTLFVFVDADYKTIKERRGQLAGSSEYTVFHRKIYMELAGVVKAVYLNTSKMKIYETHNQIMFHLSSKEPNRNLQQNVCV